MKQMLFALAAAAGMAVVAGPARADWGGVGPGSGPIPGAAPGVGAIPNKPPPRLPDRYGFAPFLRRHMGLGCGAFGACAGYPGLGMPGGPMVNQGTLVFPHHPFVRSPRDFFMYDMNR
jgi:hypothetical protein